MRIIHLNILLVFAFAVIGCGSQYTFHDNLYWITPVESSESFHAIRVIDTMTTGHGSRNEFVRIDPNGTLNLITLLDSSVSPTYGAAFVNDRTLVYDSYRNHSIRLYHLNTHKQVDLLPGYEIETISRDGKHFVARDVHQRDKRMKSFRIEGEGIVEVGSMSSENRIYFAYGDSGYCFVDGRQFEPEDITPETLDIVGPKLIPIYKLPISLTYSPYYLSLSNHRYQSFNEEKYEMLGVYSPRPSDDENTVIIRYNLFTHKLDTLFQGLYFARAMALKQSDLYLVNGKTVNELVEERKKRVEEYDERIDPESSEEGQEGWLGPDVPRLGYWLIANSKTQKMKKIGFEDCLPTISSSGKTILFMKKNSDTHDFTIQMLSLQDNMPND